jgi:hypothetical protein
MIAEQLKPQAANAQRQHHKPSCRPQNYVTAAAKQMQRHNSTSNINTAKSKAAEEEKQQ